MKEDDSFVTQGMARDRRTTYHKGSTVQERQSALKDIPIEPGKIVEVY